MFKIPAIVLFEHFNSFVYAFKNKQLLKGCFKLINEFLFRSYRKNLPYQISGFVKLHHEKDVSSDIGNIKEINNIPLNEVYYVHLAGRSHQLNVSDIWEFSYNDIEELYSLHRFSWLLILEQRKSSTLGLYCIINWIEKNKLEEEIGWDSYSISERVSNWILYLKSNNEIDKNYKKYVINSIKYQLSVLLNNLEIRGEATNNHVINNGRALYLGGIFTEEERYKNSGSVILIDSINLMFSESGFLREGSSHYQVLLARAYIEVLWFAKKSNDFYLINSLNNQVKKIWEAACFFLQEKEMPIFGDISPDFPVGFHSGLGIVGESLFSEKKFIPFTNSHGWHSFFNLDLMDNNLDSNTQGLINHEDSGYCCYRNNNFSMYIFTNPEGYVPSWSHAHSDIGNVILYIKGQPFLIGTGRKNYKNNSLSKYGRSIRSHNSVEIDSKEPLLVHGLNGYPELMLSDYYFNKSKIRFSSLNDIFTIELENNGYKRLFRDISIKRTIKIFKRKVSIEDKINDIKPHNIRTFFHFTPNISIDKKSNDKFQINLGDSLLNFSIASKSSINSEIYKNSESFGLCFPQYGEQKTCTSFEFIQEDELEVSNKYLFEIKN